MFLTAKDATEDRVAGLAAGSDDYVTKPFSMEEVLIRAHRLVQRSGVVSGGSEVLVVGDLVMNTRTHEVTRGGDEIELTATQYNLLKFLMANVRTVLSKERILQDVWGYDFGGRANIVDQVRRDGKVIAAMVLDVAEGQIQGVSSVVNPDKLQHLGPVGDLAALVRERR